MKDKTLPAVLGNISKKKLQLTIGYTNGFSVDYSIIDTDDIMDIHVYLTKTT